MKTWSTPWGDVVAADGDEAVPFLITEQLEQVYQRPGHELRRGQLVVDCGANIGLFAIQALRARCKVIAIEPDLELYHALTLNTQWFGEQIHRYCVAAWRKSEMLTLSINRANRGSSSVMQHQGGDTLSVLGLSLDDLLLNRVVDVIKIDIEGAEVNALRGATASIQRWLPRLVIAAEHGEGQVQEVKDCVETIAPGKYHCEAFPGCSEDYIKGDHVLYFERV